MIPYIRIRPSIVSTISLFCLMKFSQLSIVLLVNCSNQQAEGLMVELTLSSCYDFVEQLCEFVLKHLSVLQKLRYEFVLIISASILMSFTPFLCSLFKFEVRTMSYKFNLLDLFLVL